MNLQRRRNFLLLGLAVLSTIAILALYLTRHQPLARIPLPDGTELRLEYVTYGTDHRIPGVSHLRKRVTDLAGEWLRREIEYSTEEYQFSDTTSPQLVLWFSRYSPEDGGHYFYSNHTSRGDVSLLDDISVELLEDHGFRTEISGGDFNPVDPLPNVAVGLERFNRRNAHLHLRVEMGGKRTDVLVPNPAAKIRFPEWKPEPLPKVRRVGVHDLVLRSMKIVVGNELGICPDLQILHEGRPVEYDPLSDESEIEIRDMTVSDATGNSTRTGIFALAERGGEKPATFESMASATNFVLPFTESAWKVSFRAVRTSYSPFLKDEGQTLGPVAVPGPGEHVVFPLSDKGHKQKFRFAFLLGPGRYVWKNGAFVEAEASIETAEAKAFLDQQLPEDTLRVNTPRPILVLLSAKDATNAAAEERDVRKPSEPDHLIHLIGSKYFPGDGLESAADKVRYHGNALQIAGSYELRGAYLENGWVYAESLFPIGARISIQIVPTHAETVEFLVAPPKLPGPPEPGAKED